MEQNPQPQGTQQQWNSPPQPQAQSQQTPAPQYVQYGAPPAYHRSAFEGLVKNSSLTAIIALGMILLLIGAMMIHASTLTTNYGSNPPSAEKQMDDRAFGNSLNAYGHILMDLGIFFVATLLLLAGILRKEMDKFARLGLLLGAALIIAYWLA